MSSIRVWAEFLPFEELVRPHVLNLLAEFDVGLNVAVHHNQPFSEVARLLDAYNKAGVDVALWVLLSKHDGYFPSGKNFPVFEKHVRELLDQIKAANLPTPSIAVDLEPPLYVMEGRNWKKRADRRRIRAELREGLAKNRFEEWTRRLRDFQTELAARGARTLVAASFTIADDYRAGDEFTQAVMGTPVIGVNWDIVSIMWYVSMAVGYSKGLVPYNVARFHLWRDALALKEALGVERAGVSLGVTWTGVLGNEPYYRNAEDIRPDAEAAKAAGIQHIWIYNLEGILKSERPARWFEVIRDAKAYAPEKNFVVNCSVFCRNAGIWAVKRYLG